MNATLELFIAIFFGQRFRATYDSRISTTTSYNQSQIVTHTADLPLTTSFYHYHVPPHNYTCKHTHPPSSFQIYLPEVSTHYPRLQSAPQSQNDRNLIRMWIATPGSLGSVHNPLLSSDPSVVPVLSKPSQLHSEQLSSNQFAQSSSTGCIPLASTFRCIDFPYPPPWELPVLREGREW